MHFDNREDYIKWATVIMLSTADKKTDSNAVGNALAHAQACADLFFPAQTSRKSAPDPYNDRPEVQQPPQVKVSGPPRPGDHVNVPQDNPQR